MRLQSPHRVEVMIPLLSMLSLRRLTVTIALCAAFVGLAASPAAARVFVGIGLGVPFGGFYPPPYYYPPPPVFYAPY